MRKKQPMAFMICSAWGQNMELLTHVQRHKGGGACQAYQKCDSQADASRQKADEPSSCGSGGLRQAMLPMAVDVYAWIQSIKVLTNVQGHEGGGARQAVGQCASQAHVGQQQILQGRLHMQQIRSRT